MTNNEKIKAQFKEWYFSNYGYAADGYYPEEIWETWIAGYKARDTYIHFMREQISEMSKIIDRKYDSF